jgi:PKD repeat protein
MKRSGLIVFLILVIMLPVRSLCQCNAAFNTIVTPGFTIVQFYDASAGATTWNWNFGDGTVSTQQNPVHSYATTGTYNVCLVVSGTSGCADSVCQPVIVPAQGSCTASFTVQPVAPGFPGFLFTGTGTGVTPLTYSWDFGDGTVLPASPLNSTTYIYSNPGSYNACLTITDANNCTATTCQVVSSGTSSCPPSFISTAVPNSGTVLFQDATFSFDPAVAWTWNFGDGTSTSGSGTATHTYLQSGTYNVCLSIVTQSGCSGSACSTVVVTVPVACSASFTANASSNPSVFTFTPNVAPSTAAEIWDFGDGSLPVVNSSPIVQQHTYSASGTYNVCLTIQDGFCTDTFCTAVTVPSTTLVPSIVTPPDFIVYPNPSHGDLSIVSDWSRNDFYSLKIKDYSGRMVYETSIEGLSSGEVFQLDRSAVPSGIYLLTLNGADKNYHLRVVLLN